MCVQCSVVIRFMHNVSILLLIKSKFAGRKRCALCNRINFNTGSIITVIHTYIQ